MVRAITVTAAPMAIPANAPVESFEDEEKFWDALAELPEVSAVLVMLLRPVEVATEIAVDSGIVAEPI
jgi:hypothetical protein